LRTKSSVLRHLPPSHSASASRFKGRQASRLPHSAEHQETALGLGYESMWYLCRTSDFGVVPWPCRICRIGSLALGGAAGASHAAAKSDSAPSLLTRPRPPRSPSSRSEPLPPRCSFTTPSSGSDTSF